MGRSLLIPNQRLHPWTPLGAEPQTPIWARSTALAMVPPTRKPLLRHK
jgi:hypothetical protein